MSKIKKGVPSAIGFPHFAGSGRVVLSTKPFPHKCAKAGARTQDLPVTDGRLYRCTRPTLLAMSKILKHKCWWLFLPLYVGITNNK